MTSCSALTLNTSTQGSMDKLKEEKLQVNKYVNHCTCNPARSKDNRRGRACYLPIYRVDLCGVSLSEFCGDRMNIWKLGLII